MATPRASGSTNSSSAPPGVLRNMSGPGQPAISGARIARGPPNMSTIESTVTKLLVATKQLLESLTQWARGDASEQDVSDVYVNLGNEFNVACRAFLATGIEVADLGDVPQALRVVLEKALSEEASQDNLDRYLPSIREIIVNMLGQLKQKQAIIRSSSAPPHIQPKQPFQTFPPGPRQHLTPPMKYPTRSESMSNPIPPTMPAALPPRHNSVGGGPRPTGERTSPTEMIHMRPGSPRKDSPLMALQRSEALERRASRRFSAYQFAKLTNGSPTIRDAVPDVPRLPVDQSKRTSLLPTTATHSSSAADYTLSTSVVDDRRSTPPVQQEALVVPKEDISGQPGTVTVFLQIGRRVKKTIISRDEITIPSLRLQFIEKFAYSPGSEAFPDIYIQDPQSGVRYELDDRSLDEVRSGSALLSLNVETINEVKKHIDDGIEKLIKHIFDLNSKLEDNSQKITNMQAYSPSVTPSPEDHAKIDRPISKVSVKQIEGLRKDVAVVRQISSTSLAELKNHVSEIVKKSQALQFAASALNQNSSTSRTFMESCHKKLSSDSDTLLTSVDDLQDVIEGLRKDVAQRGVRHSPRQLESVAKDLAKARTDLNKMAAYIDTEGPSWKKIWERELDTVCEEQQFFKLQQELVEDLQDDLKKAEETFRLVEMCSQEQNKNTGRRPTAPTILPVPVTGIKHVKDAVLSEVSALQPNHERRLEAIERAEKLRKKELEMRGQGGEFEDELGEFVGENKLKKSGGVEETERRRKMREQKVLEEQMKNEAEVKAVRAQERERRKAEKADREKQVNDGITQDETPAEHLETLSDVVEEIAPEEEQQNDRDETPNDKSASDENLL
jgi:hypothetical protein